MKNNIFLITNESVYQKNKNFYCDNLDIKSIPEALDKDKNFNVRLVARRSKIERTKKINIKNININKNPISFLLSTVTDLNNKHNKYLIISIPPYPFLAAILLKILGKKIFVYLRSDGYKEYEKIFGFIGPIIYHFMFSITSSISALISCRKHILNNKIGNIVSPSQLNKNWFKKDKKINLKKIQLLYVGRIRIEKGIFSLINIIKNSKINLTIVTPEKINNYKFPSNVKVKSFQNYNDSIIQFYDDHNIFILPSYTEGHPQVLDEALARIRPVIIFNEINHVRRDRHGIIISKRNIISLKKKINYINKNYKKIQNDIRKNKLPTKDLFIKDLKKIVLNKQK